MIGNSLRYRKNIYSQKELLFEKASPAAMHLYGVDGNHGMDILHSLVADHFQKLYCGWSLSPALFVFNQQIQCLLASPQLVPLMVLTRVHSKDILQKAEPFLQHLRGYQLFSPTFSKQDEMKQSRLDLVIYGWFMPMPVSIWTKTIYVALHMQERSTCLITACVRPSKTA